METQKIEFTRINNDINGNPRYVCHYSDIPLSKFDLAVIQHKIIVAKSLGACTVGMQTNLEYQIALNKCRKLGGKKYHTKNYGGGIVFQSYNIQALEKSILELVK